jgi:hypothetical protein
MARTVDLPTPGPEPTGFGVLSPLILFNVSNPPRGCAAIRRTRLANQRPGSGTIALANNPDPRGAVAQIRKSLEAIEPTQAWY